MVFEVQSLPVWNFQESSAKLCPGDEIVKIREKLVCSSSYQEICDLMYNLPMTLSLEVKRPVSGNVLQSSPVRAVINSLCYVLHRKYSKQTNINQCC